MPGSPVPAVAARERAVRCAIGEPGKGHCHLKEDRDREWSPHAAGEAHHLQTGQCLDLRPAGACVSVCGQGSVYAGNSAHTSMMWVSAGIEVGSACVSAHAHTCSGGGAEEGSAGEFGSSNLCVVCQLLKMLPGQFTHDKRCHLLMVL